MLAHCSALSRTCCIGYGLLLIGLAWSSCVLVTILMTGRRFEHLVLSAPVGYSSEPDYMKPGMVGFFFFLYKEPNWVVHQELALIHLLAPNAPVYITSDNGNDYSTQCAHYKALHQMGGNPRCDFYMYSSNHGADWGPNSAWQPQSQFCFLWNEEVAKAVSWLDTEWVVLHESDLLVLRGLVQPQPWVNYVPVGNVQMRWSSEKGRTGTGKARPGFVQAMHDKCGTDARRQDGYGTAGGLMFRASAFMQARSDYLQNSSVWTWLNDNDNAVDSCIHAALQFACNLGAASQEFFQLEDYVSEAGNGWGQPVETVGTEGGWASAWLHWFMPFLDWPYGLDLTECAKCLHVCQALHCDTDAQEIYSRGAIPPVVTCIASHRCACPALLHGVHGGLCSGREGSIQALETDSTMYEGVSFQSHWKHLRGNDRLFGRPFRECFGLGLCKPALPEYRQWAMYFHVSFTFLVNVLLTLAWCGWPLSFPTSSSKVSPLKAL